MCSYKFYLQINVHKVGIKATVNVQNKTTIRSILSHFVSSFNHALVLVTSSSSHNCTLYEAIVKYPLQLAAGKATLGSMPLSENRTVQRVTRQEESQGMTGECEDLEVAISTAS